MPLALRRIWEPAAYQGGSVARRYFEGWYYKQADAGENAQSADCDDAGDPLSLIVRKSVARFDFQKSLLHQHIQQVVCLYAQPPPPGDLDVGPFLLLFRDFEAHFLAAGRA